MLNIYVLVSANLSPAVPHRRTVQHFASFVIQAVVAGLQGAGRVGTENVVIRSWNKARSSRGLQGAKSDDDCLVCIFNVQVRAMKQLSYRC